MYDPRQMLSLESLLLLYETMMNKKNHTLATNAATVLLTVRHCPVQNESTRIVSGAKISWDQSWLQLAVTRATLLRQLGSATA